MRPIGRQAGAQPVERLDGEAVRIARRLHHERGDGGHQHGLGDAPLAVPRDVTRHLAASRRMADMHGVPQVEVIDDVRRVGGVVIHVVPIPYLARAPVPAAVDANDAITVLEEEQHLRIPVVGAQGPAVVEDNRLAVAPILVEYLDAVFGGDRAHGVCSFASV